MQLTDCYVEEDKGSVRIGNSKVEIEVEREHGLVVGLLNKQTGHQYIERRELANNFRVVIPIQPWGEGHHIRGEEQTLTGYEKEERPDGGVSLTLRYDKLTSPKGTFNVSLTFEIVVKPDEDQIVWTAKMMNNEEELTVEELWFPILSGIVRIGESAEDDAIVLPHHSGDKIKKPMHSFPGYEKPPSLEFLDDEPAHGNPLRFRINYPVPASMQWFDYYDEREGIYLASYDRSLSFTGLQAEKVLKRLGGEGREAIAVSFVKYPFVGPRGEWISPEIVVALHLGDWHVGADRYREWAEGWMEKPKVPKWVRECNGWVSIGLKQKDGCVVYEYDDLPRELEYAKRHGINLLYLFGWYEHGQDSDLPNYVPWDVEAMTRNLDEVRSRGGRSILFTSAFMVNVTNPEYRQFGSLWACRRRSGVEPIADNWEPNVNYYTPYRLNPETMAFMCPYVDGWHEFMKHYAVKIIRDYHADGFHLDLLAIWQSYLCFSPYHGHENPAMAYGPGCVRMVKRLREAIKAVNPDCALTAEGFCDAYAQYVDLHWQMRLWSHRGFPGRPERFLEMYRYTFPYHILVRGGVTPNEYHDTNYMFIVGERFDTSVLGVMTAAELDEMGVRIRDYPEYADYIRRLCDARQAAKDYMIYGRFMDDIGLKVSDPSVIGKVFTNKKGLTVALWNRGEVEAKPTLSLDLSKLGVEARGKYAVKELVSGSRLKSPSGSEAWKGSDLKTGVTAGIQPHRAALILVEKTS